MTDMLDMTDSTHELKRKLEKVLDDVERLDLGGGESESRRGGA